MSFEFAACVILLVPLTIIPTDGEVGRSTQNDCRERPPAQGLLQQAGDTRRTYENRKEAYESAAQVCPHDPSIYAALSALLLEHQEGENALKFARRGLEIAPQDQALTAYEGVALLSVGRPDEALAVLRKAPPNARNEFYLGMAYRALRKNKEAQQALSQAFAAGFNDPYVLYVLIGEDRALGDKEAGLRDFRTFYKQFTDSPWLHMLYGDAYESKNEDSKAEVEYEQVLKFAPGLPIVHYQLGYIEFKQAMYSEAENHFRKEIAIDPTFALAYLYLGATLRRLGRNSEALPFLEQAVNRDPNYTLAYSELATAQTEAGKVEEALRTLRKGESRFPDNAALHAQLAGLLRRLGRTNDANKESQKATSLSLKNNPIRQGVIGEAESPSPLSNESRNLPSTGLPSHALASASQGGDSGHAQERGVERPARNGDPVGDWDSLNPILEPLHRCVESSDPSCATKALTQIRGPIKESADYLALEAQAFALERRKDDALAAINAAVKKDPSQYRYLITQGRIYQTFNDQASAIRSFLFAAQVRPNSSETFYFLGMSFFFLDEYSRAEKHFSRAVELDSKNDRAVFMLGVSKMITFKLPEAKGYFEQALALQPNAPYYHLHYGILLSRMGDTGMAIEQLRTAERLDPSYALTHYNLGHVYRETGDYMKAKEELETAIRIRPNLAEAYYDLGRIYRRLGMEEDSRKAYDKFEKAKAEQKREVLDPLESTLNHHQP